VVDSDTIVLMTTWGGAGCQSAESEVESMSDQQNERDYAGALRQLSPIQLDIMRYRCAGRTSDEIASLVSVQVETARYLLADIYDRLGITWQQETTSLAALSRYCPYVSQVAPAGVAATPDQTTQPLPPQPSQRAFQLVQEDDEALRAQRVPAEEEAGPSRQVPLLIFGGIAVVAVAVLLVFLLRGGGGSSSTPTAGVPTATATTASGAATSSTAPTQTPVPTPTEAQPTPTPVPPTPTPQPSPTPTPTPMPSPTPTPAPTPTPQSTETPTAGPTAVPTPQTGTVQYQANWSSGADNWQLGAGWTAANGMLSSGSGSGSIAAPFVPPNGNYAVEADIKVLSGSDSCPSGAGVFGRGTSGQTLSPGYAAATCNNGWVLLAAKKVGNQTSTLGQGPRQGDTSSHTYRLEIKGNQQRMFIDSTFIGESTDSVWTAPGVAGVFLSGNYQIQVSAFRVFALP
jgi:DNA-binding CsgD family transcriptional regulator